jgi:hypothetical protein
MSRQSSAGLLFAALFGALVASGAEAQIFISATGKDTNNCSRTAPCRTLQRGINATSPGRELTILTSGEYGRATVNKGMSILAESLSANVRSFTAGSTAILVNAPGGRVVLKGLFLNGGNGGSYGIRIIAATAVDITDCVVERFATNGILSDAADSELSVSDTVVRSNGSDGLRTNNNTSKLVVDGSRIENNGSFGVYGTASQASITRSISSGNNAGGFGFGFQSGSPGTANYTETTSANNGGVGFRINAGSRATLESVVARGNGDAGLGLNGPDARAVISNSTFTNNRWGIENNGIVLTRGNNTIARNNQSDFTGSATTPLAPF